MVEKRAITPQPDENGRIRERNFDAIPSHIEGVMLLVDHDEEPDLRRSDTRLLEETAGAYFERDQEIKKLLALQEDPHNVLVKLGKHYPGLRGIRDLNSGFEVQITPERTDEFDAELLHQSLGEDASKYLHENASISINLDSATLTTTDIDVKGLSLSIRRMLKRRGLTPDQITNRVKETFGLRVDKGPLAKAVIEKKVFLAPGAWKKGITGWRIDPRPINSISEIAEAGEAAKLRSQLE